MKLDKNEYRVALFILVPIVVILLFVILKLGYSVASSTIDIYLKVDSITSIKKGTQVKVKGYSIGRIIEIKPVYQPELHFLAVMRIQKDIEIFEECYAKILNQNIIGEPIVDIMNPEIKTDLIKEGSVIEGSEEVNLEAVLTNVQALLTNLNKTVDVLRGMTTENRGNIRQLFANLAVSIESLNPFLMQSEKELGPTFVSLKEMTNHLNAVSKELEERGAGFLIWGKGKKDKEKE